MGKMRACGDADQSILLVMFTEDEFGDSALQISERK